MLSPNRKTNMNNGTQSMIPPKEVNPIKCCKCPSWKTIVISP